MKILRPLEFVLIVAVAIGILIFRAAQEYPEVTFAANSNRQP